MKGKEILGLYSNLRIVTVEIIEENAELKDLIKDLKQKNAAISNQFDQLELLCYRMLHTKHGETKRSDTNCNQVSHQPYINQYPPLPIVGNSDTRGFQMNHPSTHSDCSPCNQRYNIPDELKDEILKYLFNVIHKDRYGYHKSGGNKQRYVMVRKPCKFS